MVGIDLGMLQNLILMGVWIGGCGLSACLFLLVLDLLAEDWGIC